jgi:hypothetical protein
MRATLCRGRTSESRARRPHPGRTKGKYVGRAEHEREVAPGAHAWATSGQAHRGGLGSGLGTGPRVSRCLAIGPPRPRPSAAYAGRRGLAALTAPSYWVVVPPCQASPVEGLGLAGSARLRALRASAMSSTARGEKRDGERKGRENHERAKGRVRHERRWRTLARREGGVERRESGLSSSSCGAELWGMARRMRTCAQCGAVAMGRGTRGAMRLGARTCSWERAHATGALGWRGLLGCARLAGPRRRGALGRGGPR